MAMYQPALRYDQSKSLYYLRLQHRLPMTKLLRRIVDTYLEASPIELKQLVREVEGNIRRRDSNTTPESCCLSGFWQYGKFKPTEKEDEACK